MTEPDPAKTRFLLLGLVRLSGVIFAFLGIAIIMKRLVEPAEIIGGVLIAMGALDVLVLPALLVRRWRTPPSA
jgi:hypothetical protein